MISLFFSGGILLVLWISLPQTVFTAFHHVDLSRVVDDTPVFGQDDSSDSNLTSLQAWVSERVDPFAELVSQADAETQWDYNVNITDQNEEATILVANQSATFVRLIAGQAAKFNVTGNDTVKDRRLHKKLSELGSAALSEADLTELNKIVNWMTNVYSTATVCFDETIPQLKDCPKDKLVHLEPNVTKYMREGRNPTKLKYLWKNWRDATGSKMRQNFTRYVELKNKAAVLNGYKDAGEMWRSNYAEVTVNYTDSDVLRDLGGLWKQIEPLYRELHAYIRRKLITQYPKEKIKADGPLPAHLLAGMWAQDWAGLLNFTQLFPKKSLLDVTEEMKRQNYTVEKMFRLSETFQKELGLKPMPQSFWNLSMFERPEGREVVCHASAWDMYRLTDVRIKMCTEVNMEDLITIHHEMGHIQYYLQYENQIVPFREGANSGFHEAVGDTLTLSVRTPKHLSWLGLLKNNTEDQESDLNFMFATALDKIVFLPFGYIMDRWRYDVFSGLISSAELNDGWWKYVLEYQGIAPPVNRSENDFDPGAKYHVAADVEYMRYFVSFVIQFQFHKGLCEAAGHKGPLYQCDVNQSKEAGKRLSDMLSLGSSEPWPVALEKITGSSKMDASALLEFFQPLMDHLHKVNKEKGNFVGWK